MKIEFTQYEERDPEYNPEDGFSGFVTVTAEGLADAKRLVEYFKLSPGDDPEALITRAELLQIDNLTHEHRPTKRPYYEVRGSLCVQLFAAYKDWARRTFGFDGRFPDLTLTPKRGGLCYTHLVQSIQTEVGETVCYTAFAQSEPWHVYDAQTYAERKVTRYIAEEFGHVEPMREFIRSGSHWKPNPDWGTGRRNPVQPRVVHEELCNKFAEWWIKHEANEKQRDILQRNAALAAATGRHSLVNWVRDYDLRYIDSEGPCDYDGKGLMTSHMRLEEFAAL